MKEMTLNERFSKIVDVNEKDFQFEIAIEEAGEFIQAVQKFKRGRGSIKDVVNEMADVLVTFGCLKESINRDHKESFDVYKLIDGIMKQKTAWIEKYDEKKDASLVSLTWQDFKDDMDDKLAELILEDFNNAVDVKDTVWYDSFTTLYERIILTIGEYDKAKREGGG